MTIITPSMFISVQYERELFLVLGISSFIYQQQTATANRPFQSSNQAAICYYLSITTQS